MSSKGVVLYRSILKAHRSRLPWDLRQLGNAYVRNEFQLHKKVEHPQNLKIFFDAWEKYLVMMESRTEKFGKDMVDEERRVMSNEQKEKMVELKKEAADNNHRVSKLFPDGNS
jgi:hypothetical protein